MGNSSSSAVTQTIDTKNINKSVINALNQQVTESVTQNIAKAQIESGASVVQIGKQKIGPIVAKGPNSNITNIKLSIDQNTQINLKTDDNSIQDTTISSQLALAILDNVKSSVNNDNMAKLMGSAEAQQSLGAISLTGGNQVSFDVNAKISTLNLTDTYRDFSNIVTNKIVQKSESLTFKKCIVDNLQQADQEVGGIYAIDGGTVSGFEMNIGQTTSVIQNCIFKTVQSSNIMEDIANSLGFTVTDDTTNKNTDEASGGAKSTQQIKGLEDLLAWLALLFASPVIIVGVIVVLIILCCSSSSMIYLFKSSSNNNNNDNVGGEEDNDDNQFDGGYKKPKKYKFKYSSNPLIDSVTSGLVYLSKF